LAISPDGPEALAAFSDRAGIRFPLLGDRDLSVTSKFGVVSEANASLPHPAVVIVDGEGTVRFVRVDEDYRQRPAAHELLAVMSDLGVDSGE
jgi:peroxiredoxin